MQLRARRIAIGVALVLAGGAIGAYVAWNRESRLSIGSGATRPEPAREISTPGVLDALAAERLVAERDDEGASGEGADQSPWPATCRVRSCDGEAVEGCEVALVQREGGTTTTLASGTTNGEGIIELAALRRETSGAIWVRVELKGWRTAFERVDLARDSTAPSATIDIELHPAVTLEVEVRTAWNAPVADAEVEARVWREIGRGRAIAVAGIPAERPFTARTDANGHCVVHACRREAVVLAADAFGFMESSVRLDPAADVVRPVAMTLNAILVVMRQDPEPREGESVRATSYLRCAGVDGVDVDGVFGVSDEESRRISSDLRQRLGVEELSLLFLTETDATKYPPLLRYAYVVPAAAIEESGEVPLRRIWDARKEEIIRPRSPVVVPAPGAVVVRFAKVEQAADLPRGEWGLVSKSDSMSGTFASSLKGDARPDFEEGRISYRFDVPAGDYRIACMPGRLWGKDFAPVQVSVRAGETIEVTIPDYAPRQHCRVSFRGVTEAGESIERMTVALEVLTVRKDGREKNTGENMGIGVDASSESFDLPYGIYFVSAMSGDQEASGRLTVDAPEQQVILQFKPKKK